jgi:hypothetical protein
MLPDASLGLEACFPHELRPFGRFGAKVLAEFLGRAGDRLTAVTPSAHSLPEFVCWASADRTTEFEVLGGKLIELPARDWKPIVEAP